MDQLADYFAAWNESSDEGRRTLLLRSVTEDVKVIHPTWGRSVGVDALLDHIKGVPLGDAGNVSCARQRTRWSQ